MAIALHSYKVDKDGKITVRHTFYAADEDAADDLMDAHADGCAAFGPAVDDGRTIDLYEEIEELPDAEQLRRMEEDQEAGEGEEDEEPEEDADEEEGE
jgi:hypothetical protein